MMSRFPAAPRRVMWKAGIGRAAFKSRRQQARLLIRAATGDQALINVGQLSDYGRPRMPGLGLAR